MIKLVASDLDGTIIGRDNTIVENNLNLPLYNFTLVKSYLKIIDFKSISDYNRIGWAKSPFNYVNKFSEVILLWQM